jgi:putative transposase
MSQPFLVRRLTPAEQRAIRKVRKRPPNLDVYRRAQAVHFSSRGLKVHQIAEIVSRSRVTITRWLHDFDANGLQSLWPGKSTGRPPKADAEFQAGLAAAVEQNPRDLGYAFTRWTADLLAEHLYRTTHVRVCASTLYASLKRLGYRYGRPKLDLKHRQDPKEVARAKRQKRAALKKRKPAPVVVLSRISTRPSSTSIPACRSAGRSGATG